jgi:xylulose-5-phosphate/fructose-6-phosphate phosphoketolase
MNEVIKSIKEYVRAANYLTVSQIYLQDNFLGEKGLKPDDIKPRLLGHWGTCPGINFVYANLNYLIKKHQAEFLFVLGPGHGFPALQANLFLEKTLGKYYPKATHDKEGIGYLSKNFSWPRGFPSHSNPETPGVILEGGELGYALSTSYGAVLDNPDLIVACLIGDGEAETGPTATAWHLNKFIDPKKNGAVLPILHLNEYKISGPTIFGRMSDEELTNLFEGYGYEPHIVTDDYARMIDTLETCYQKIREIQKGSESPRFPMIILKTPKGWTGIKKFNGEKIEGNYLSHQVPLKNVKKDPEELKALDKWMKSYKFGELFDEENGFKENILDIIPNLTMGNSKYSFGTYKPLVLPDLNKFAEEIDGNKFASNMERIGEYLNEVFNSNDNFRLMSPDETYSNKLDAVFKTTNRAFVWPIKPWDKNMSSDGRVIEVLSEHSLQGLIQGYVLTGRHGIFASYEAFIQIVSSMADQYAKFLKVARDTKWRKDIPSLNYILTSSGWRQEHNGFSHQNPGFIDSMLQKQGCFVNVYFPADINSSLVVIEKCLSSKNEINIIVTGKRNTPQWLNMNQAKKELSRGLAIWGFASDPEPDIVLVGVGDYLTLEVMAATQIVREEAPEIKVRVVNVMTLSAMGLGGSDCRVPFDDFDEYFTPDKPVIFNFHGYPQTVKQILFDYKGDAHRASVFGYVESGSTTTPFDMQTRNKTSRYHLTIEVFKKMVASGVLSPDRGDLLVMKYEQKIKEHEEYIIKHGVDPDEIKNWQWKRNT